MAITPLATISADDTDDTGTDISRYDGVLAFILNAKATAGTSPTLDVKLQHSDDADGDPDTFDDVPSGAFTQVTSANSSAAVLHRIELQKNALKKYVRVAKDIGGTSSPAFIASVTMLGHKQYDV